MPKKKTQTPAEKEMPFEKAMERVESIVEAMESDSLQLEEMLIQYEEGARLLAACQDRIDAAQKRVEVIAAARQSGSVTLKPFDSSKDEPDPSSAENNQDSEEGSDDIRLF